MVLASNFFYDRYRAQISVYNNSEQAVFVLFFMTGTVHRYMSMTTVSNQFDALNAHQIDLHFLFLNSYELKTTSLSISLHIHPKKTQDFDSKFFMVYRAIEAYDSWWVTFFLRFWVLENIYMC